MIDLFREISQTLRNNKSRTILTGISVAWGIFMLIVLLGASRGVYNAATESFSADKANTISVYGGNTSMPFKGYKEGRSVDLKLDDSEVIDRNVNENITQVQPLISTQLSKISTTRDYISGEIIGSVPGFFNTQNTEIVYGRFINGLDLKETRKVVVISEKDAAILFDNVADAIGANVKIGDMVFKVVGIYSSNEFRQSIIPLTTARMINGYKNDIYEMSVIFENVSTVEEGEAIEKDVFKALAQKHEFNPDDESALWIWNRFSAYMQMKGGLDILNAAVWVIGLLTMLSGIIGVSNIMFVSVKERTHEIGIRRAIGAKPRSILFQIILESVSITGMFGYIGVFFGMIVTEIINLLFGDTAFISNPTVSLAIALQITVVLVIAGCLAGFFPALRALKIKPVEALRTE